MFVNTRLLSPVVFDGLTQAPPDSYEWHEWWDEQHRRCIEGYSVGDTKISGRHYHYLNFSEILREPEGGGKKRRLAPRFLDIDHDFYWEYERCLKAGKDILVLKRRQCGFSYKTAQICAYDFSFIPDSYTIITSGVEGYSVDTMKKALAVLDFAASGEFYKHREPDSADFNQAMFWEKLPSGQRIKTGIFSILHRITSSNLQAMVGKSPSMVLYEEIGKFKGLKATKAYIDPGMEERGRRTGINVLIGTGGEEHESIDEVTDMFYKPATYNLMEYDNVWGSEIGLDDVPDLKNKCAYFIPGDRFMDATDDDGNSHPEESRKIIMERRAKIEGDKKNWLIEVTQYPLTPEEALMTPEGGKFNAYKLNKRKAEILRSPELRDIVELGNLEWVRDSNDNILGVEYSPDPINGIYRITEMPARLPNGEVPEFLYVAGTDSYDKDKAADEKRASFGACRIHKQWNGLDDTNDIPVCSLVERPERAEIFYEDTAKMCVFYGWASNLIEYSNILIFDWYRRNGFSRLIRQRPETAYAAMNKSNVQSRDGIDPNTKYVWEQIAVDWVEKNAHRINDVQLIDKLIKYRSDKNCDESIAFMLSLLHAHDNAKVELTEKVPEVPFRMHRYSMRGGRMVRL